MDSSRERCRYPPRHDYRLTPMGRDLDGVALMIRRWERRWGGRSVRSLSMRGTKHLGQVGDTNYLPVLQSRCGPLVSLQPLYERRRRFHPCEADLLTPRTKRLARSTAQRIRRCEICSSRRPCSMSACAAGLQRRANPGGRYQRLRADGRWSGRRTRPEL